MCIENFCKQWEHTIQLLGVIAVFCSVRASLRHPFKLKGELSFDGTRIDNGNDCGPFALKCTVERGTELLLPRDLRTQGNPWDTEFRGLYGFVTETIFKSKKISTVLGENDDHKVSHPLLLQGLIVLPLQFIDYPEKNFHSKDHSALLKTLPCKKKFWGRVIVFFPWKLYLQHMYLGVIKIKPTKEARKIIIQLLLTRLSEEVSG